MRASLFVAGMLCASAALAQQYRWIDEQGRVHYTDTPPPPTATGVEKKNLARKATGRQDDPQLAKAAKESPVILYSHPDCKAPCDTARAILAKRGVPFQEVSVVDQERYDELKRLSGDAQVPVLVVGKRVERAPIEAAYNEALDQAGYPSAR